MNLLFLLTSFNGRIGRIQWWMGFIVWLSISFAGTWFLYPEFFLAEELPPPNSIETGFQVVWQIPITALTVKRFNDRGWPWWFGFALAGISLVLLIVPHFGIEIAPGAEGFGTPAFWIVAVIGLAAIIDNGFIRGTDGPNRYGSDPLHPAALKP